MGRKDLVAANSNEIQNPYEGNYSIREIAQKIIDDPEYVDQVEKIIPVFVDSKKGRHFRLLVRDKAKIYKGVELGEYGDCAVGYGYPWTWTKKEDVSAPCDGLFVPNFMANFRERNTRNGKILVLVIPSRETIEIGKIYHNDYPFYIKNKGKIQREILIIQKEKEEAHKIAKEEEEEERLRKVKKLQDDIEKVSKPLMDLEKYTLKHELPMTTTIDVLDQELSYVYNQKDSIADLKPIADYKTRFESIYIEAKKNQNLDNITEGRMLNTLRTFFEILGESKAEIEKLLCEIQNSSEDEKFSVLFKEHVASMNNATENLKTTFESKKKLDAAQLATIETISIYFAENNEKISHKKILEASKELLEYIWKEYSKIESKSSTEKKTLKRILKNIYETFGMSINQINEIFSKQANNESERKFEVELNQIKEKINDALIKIQNSVSNAGEVDFSQLQIIEESLSPLVEQKDRIKNKRYFEGCRTKIEAIYDEYNKKGKVSETVIKSMDYILGMLYTILNYTDEQKKEIFESIQKADDERKFNSKLNENEQKINEALIKIQNSVSNDNEIDFTQFQVIEETLSPLVEQKEKIKDLSYFEDCKSKVEAIYSECHKQENTSDPVKNSVLRVLDIVYDILGYNEKQKQEIYDAWQKEDDERKFESELSQIKQKVNETIIKLQNAIANRESVDFNQLTIIEEALSPLVEQKNKIKDLGYFENFKSKIDAVYDEYHKQDSVSDLISKSLIHILTMLYDILNYTDEQKLEILKARQKAYEERSFAKKITAQKENIKKLTSKIRELEILAENRGQPKTEVLQNIQCIEDLLKELVNQKDVIEGKSELERDKIIFDAILKGSKKWKDFSKGSRLHMQEIANGFNEIWGKDKKGFFHK